MNDTPSAVFAFGIELLNDTTVVETLSFVPRINNQDTVISLSERRTFDKIKLYAIHQGLTGTYTFSYNILNSSLTDVTIKDLIDPVNAKDAVNKQFLENNYKVETEVWLSGTDYTVTNGTLSSMSVSTVKLGSSYIKFVTGLGTLTAARGSTLTVTFISTSYVTGFLNLTAQTRSATATGSGVDVFYTRGPIIGSPDNRRLWFAHDFTATGQDYRTFEFIMTLRG